MTVTQTEFLIPIVPEMATTCHAHLVAYLHCRSAVCEKYVKRGRLKGRRIRHTGERGRSFTSCLHWETQIVESTIEIRLKGRGTHTAPVITLEHEMPVGISGKSTLAASDLKSFRLVLTSEEATIVAITTAENPRVGALIGIYGQSA